MSLIKKLVEKNWYSQNYKNKEAVIFWSVLSDSPKIIRNCTDITPQWQGCFQPGADISDTNSNYSFPAIALPMDFVPGPASLQLYRNRSCSIGTELFRQSVHHTLYHDLWRITKGIWTPVDYLIAYKQISRIMVKQNRFNCYLMKGTDLIIYLIWW